MKGEQYCRTGGLCPYMSSLGQQRASLDLISCGPNRSGPILSVDPGLFSWGG